MRGGAGVSVFQRKTPFGDGFAQVAWNFTIPGDAVIPASGIWTMDLGMLAQLPDQGLLYIDPAGLRGLWMGAGVVTLGASIPTTFSIRGALSI